MTLDDSSHHVYGKSGCNRFNASYTLSRNIIGIKPLMGTMMVCDPETMKLEQAFTAAMNEKEFKIYTRGSTIHFEDLKTKKDVLVFKIPNENEVWSFIGGKKWKLIQMDGISKDYGNAMLQFDVKGKKVNGNSGCNKFSGTFTAKGAEMNFSELNTTRMACLNEDLADTEKKIMAYLSGAGVRFDVAEQSLNFYRGTQLIMMFSLIK